MLELRDVPAILFWTNMASDHDAHNAANWLELVGESQWQTTMTGPQVGDALVFDGNVTSASADGLQGFDLSQSVPDYLVIALINGYSGTVTLAADSTPGLTTNIFLMQSGAISQPGSGTDLSVLTNFSWSGGTLNNTPSYATVNIYGGGTITLPGEGNTLTTGSTLNFDSLGPATETIISGAGTLLQNGLSEDGIFVRANSGVSLQLSDDLESKIDNAGVHKKVTLEADSKWEYIGTGTRTCAHMIFNEGGLFSLSGQCTIKLTGGFGEGVFSLPSYKNSDNANAKLHVMSGCTLESTHGVRIYGGEIRLILNPAPNVNQVSTIKGMLDIHAGNITFSDPVQVGNSWSYGAFYTNGTVRWFGGTYKPGIDAQNQNWTNRWFVAGTLTVTTQPTNAPNITPVPFRLGPGQLQPQGTWKVIETSGQDSSLGGDNPLVPQGWNLLAEMDNNVIKKWSVKRD